MSKIAILGDVHIGVREDKEVFHANYEKFFSNIFFPELKKRGIKSVIQLGDLFDRRKYINYYSLKRSKEYLFDPLEKNDIELHVIVGNHDIALRNTLEINSLDLLLKQYSNITPYSKPTVLSTAGTKFLMLPWICTDNYKESMEALKNEDADVVCGHLEISGFQMYRGVESHEGFNVSEFSRFDLVLSGHYHHRSSRGNIHYVGAPCQHTHQDQGDIRGFYIFDTETKQLEFIQNTYDMFDRFVYDDTVCTDHRAIDVSNFKEKFVKIVVQKKTDFYQFDLFMERVYNSGAHDVKVMEVLQDMTAEEMDENVDIEDTQSILKHYIENADVTVDKETLSKYMSQLYIEAIHITQ